MTISGNDYLHHLASEQLDSSIILYVGREVFDCINNLERHPYHFVPAQSVHQLNLMMKSWRSLQLQKPEAIFLGSKHIDPSILSKLKETRKQEGFSSVPFIVFSTEESKESIDMARFIGASDYFHKPVDFESILAKINFSKELKELGVSQKDSAMSEDEDARLYFFKRLFDVLVSGFTLLLIAPLLLLIAIVIRLESKGPIFYISKRAGNNYKVFDFYKFRSMGQNADAQLEQLKNTSNQYKDGNQFVKIKNDPRITRFGNILRKTSLDELPQLFNVLKGDMSIVGNRPLPLYEAELLTTDDHAERFLAPAGITGLWQALKRGKGEMSSEERIMLDRIYVRKNSFLFDFKIILMTVPALIQSEKV